MSVRRVLDAETSLSVRSIVTLQAIESLTAAEELASPDQPVNRDLTLEDLRCVALDDATYAELFCCVKERPLRFA